MGGNRMSNEPERYPSRLKKKKKNRSNSILNIMIGLVFALILITGAFIFLGNDKESAQEPETVQITTETEEQASGSESSDEEADETEAAANEADQPKNDSEDNEADADDEAKAAESDQKEEKQKEEKQKEGKVTVGGTITREESNDPIVEETVINTSWEPVGTAQKGDHVSVYDKNSVDWKEKVAAISYATGLKEDNMYIMRLQNGGGPQKSIGVIQSKNQKEKYRVHLEWVDGEGWKPVKMDILKTLEGAY
jgi:type IV secretory pathway VirB10-like protein